MEELTLRGEFEGHIPQFEPSGELLVMISDEKAPVMLSYLFSYDKIASCLALLVLLFLITRTGRPLGGESFVSLAEVLAGRFLRKRNPGPKRRR